MTMHKIRSPGPVFLNGTNGVVIAGPDADTGAFSVKCQHDNTNTEQAIEPASLSSYVSGALDVEELEVCSNKSFQYCGKILLYKMYQRCY